MRLIDADAWEPFFYEHMSDEEMIRAKIALDDMPTIEERPYREWIPCTERLPEEQKDVLVWYEYFRYGSYNRMFQTYGIARLYGDFWAGDVQGTKAKCIAWMPLPEPYKEDGEAE